MEQQSLGDITSLHNMLLKISSPLLRPNVQEKRSLSKLLLPDNTLGYTRAPGEIYCNEIIVLFS